MTTVTLRREVVKQALDAAQKFRAKVHNGTARSVETYNDLTALVSPLSAALDAPAKPASCPYCADSHTLGAVYFDQNCAGCVKRMAPAKPVDCRGCEWLSVRQDRCMSDTLGFEACTDFDRFQALPPIVLTEVTK